MIRPLCLLLLATQALTATATDVGVSINIAQPGFYGRIDLGAVPPPVVYAQPVLIQSAPYPVPAQPIYLHVPPGHERHWSRHCREYNACGAPVYFVRDDWYRREYAGRDGRGGGDRDRREEGERGRHGDEDHGRGGNRGGEREQEHEHRQGHHRDD
jgi:hypothetical protein